MYYFTFVNFKQIGLLLEAIHLRSFCGEFLISGDDKLRNFLSVSYRALNCSGQRVSGRGWKVLGWRLRTKCQSAKNPSAASLFISGLGRKSW